MVHAVLAIVQEQGGGPFPGAGEVAARAGVSERTVFRHFADLDSLFLAANDHQRPVVDAYLAPVPAEPDLEGRIASIVRLRAKLYEEIAPVRRIAARLATAHPVMAEVLNDAYRRSRRQVSATFAPELTRSGRAKPAVLDEVDLIASWPVWDMLRTRQGCSVERSRRIVSELLTSVLTPYEAVARKAPAKVARRPAPSRAAASRKAASSPVTSRAGAGRKAAARKAAGRTTAGRTTASRKASTPRAAGRTASAAAGARKR